MAFNTPPNTPPGPPSPAPSAKTLADVSAMGTTQGAPVTQVSKGPMMQGQVGGGPPRPPVAPHAEQPSVGTQPSASLSKQANPVFPMGQPNA
jgi:hypothetical protein